MCSTAGIKSADCRLPTAALHSIRSWFNPQNVRVFLLKSAAHIDHLLFTASGFFFFFTVVTSYSSERQKWSPQITITAKYLEGPTLLFPWHHTGYLPRVATLRNTPAISCGLWRWLCNCLLPVPSRPRSPSDFSWSLISAASGTRSISQKVSSPGRNVTRSNIHPRLENPNRCFIQMCINYANPVNMTIFSATLAWLRAFPF